MRQSWLTQHNPIWIIAALLVATTISAELGFRLGRRWYPRFDDARRGHFGSILDSLLGLLARILVMVLQCATVHVVLDLDRPREGFPRINQSPMLHLQSILEGDPETRP
jgi:hypothetical protein